MKTSTSSIESATSHLTNSTNSEKQLELQLITANNEKMKLENERMKIEFEMLKLKRSV